MRNVFRTGKIAFTGSLGWSVFPTKTRTAFSTNVTSTAGQGKAVATSFSLSHKQKPSSIWYRGVRRKRGRMKVVVVLIAVFSASVSAFQNGGVAELTSETFDNLAVSNLAVVEFFAPW